MDVLRYLFLQGAYGHRIVANLLALASGAHALDLLLVLSIPYGHPLPVLEQAVLWMNMKRFAAPKKIHL